MTLHEFTLTTNGLWTAEHGVPDEFSIESDHVVVDVFRGTAGESHGGPLGWHIRAYVVGEDEPVLATWREEGHPQVLDDIMQAVTIAKQHAGGEEMTADA